MQSHHVSTQTLKVGSTIFNNIHCSVDFPTFGFSKINMRLDEISKINTQSEFFPTCTCILKGFNPVSILGVALSPSFYLENLITNHNLSVNLYFQIVHFVCETLNRKTTRMWSHLLLFPSPHLHFDVD